MNITVSAGWEALTCTATTAVLGSAGAWNLWHDFNGGVPGTWYHQALANKLAGSNLSAGVPDDGTGYGIVDIKTQFNVYLGNTGCLDGTRFYLGVDGHAGSSVNFVTTLLHELGHGLGFSVLTSNSSGNRISPVTGNYTLTGGLPAVWETYLYDNTAGKTWLAMSNAERQASAINPLALAWIGAQSVAGAAATLTNLPKLKLASAAPGASGLYDCGTASAIGPSAANLRNFGRLAFGGNGLGCSAAGGVPATVAGKVAVISRGTCGFAEKAKHAQIAGAVGVIIANNQAGGAMSLGGADATVTIPVISLSQVDGAKGRRRCAGPSADEHAFGAGGRLLGFALGLQRLSQPADGTGDQQRPDHLAGAGERHHAAFAEGHRLVNPAADSRHTERGAAMRPFFHAGRPRAMARWR